MAHIHEKIDFVVSAFIVYDSKVLLVNHKKLKTWLPIGGHIELDEDPDQALFREILEEAGIDAHDIEVLSEKPDIIAPETKPLLRPRFVDIHHISGNHYHVGNVYFIRAHKDEIILNTQEHNDIRWFSVKELNNSENNILKSVLFYAKKAIEEVT